MQIESGHRHQIRLPILPEGKIGGIALIIEACVWLVTFFCALTPHLLPLGVPFRGCKKEPDRKPIDLTRINYLGCFPICSL